MTYHVIGLMSGSSLDGLDIVFVELKENNNNWQFTLQASACIEYDNEWCNKLKQASHLTAYDYNLLHTAYGHFIGKQVNGFIETNQLKGKVDLITSHGHTVFHSPLNHTTTQLGDGAAIAAITEINVVSDLRAIDVALGGQGAPIVPVGEKLLFNEYDYLLNIGGIANISINREDYVAFDICPANRILNMLANNNGQPYDAGGLIAAKGIINNNLLSQLNNLDYYKQAYPKSLANSFGTDIIYPLIQSFNLPVENALRTYVEHIAIQIKDVFIKINPSKGKLFITGGGALNTFLIERISFLLTPLQIETIIPSKEIINYKEAIIMSLLGVLRIRNEYTVLSTVTGASRNSIGGALWFGRR